jgi:hypothetical protein
MFKLLKVLGILAVVISSIGQASAFSGSTFPVSVTGSFQDVIVSYSSATSFTLTDVSLQLGNPGAGTNFLVGGSGTLASYTGTSGGPIAAGSGTLSEIISAPAGSYTFSFSTTADRLSVAVTPVPLPASFPLFVMALIGLGMFGYHTSRKNGGLAARV